MVGRLSEGGVQCGDTLVVGLVAVCFLPQDGQLKSQLSIDKINLSFLLNRSANPHSFFCFVHVRAGEMACETAPCHRPRNFRPRGEIELGSRGIY